MSPSADVTGAIREDLDTIKAVGAFRRPLDTFDAQVNPGTPDPTCVYALVYLKDGKLYVLPLKDPDQRPPTPT